MTRPSFRSGPVLALLVLGLAIGQAEAVASTFTVNPTKILLAAGRPSATLTLRNESGDPIRFQLKAFSWDQAPDGEMQLAPTEDIVVFPEMLTLAPGQERRVRIGTPVAAGPAERSYRLFVEELPPLQKPEQPSGVRVLTKMGIPVFVQPAEGRVMPALLGLVLTDGFVSFRVRNAGTIHADPHSVRVSALDESGATLLNTQINSWYVLAGGERVHEVDMKIPECSRVRSVMVEAGLEPTPVVARLETPAGTCGPAR